MIDPEVKAQWLIDLRSGEFTQGRYYLEYVDAKGDRRMCCLGVLCARQISDRRRYIEANAMFSPNAKVALYRGAASSERVFTVPKDFMDKIGLKEEEMLDLALMNDSCHKTFEQIGDWIEVNL